MSDSYGPGHPAEPLAGPLLRQIGTHLRLAREERGQDLPDVADFLRIRRAYLQDLEEGELHKIPGRTYALGFLRSYADHLGFDGEAIVEEVKRANAELPESPQLQIREPLSESQRPPLAMVGASILLAAVVYVGWTYWQDHQSPDVQAELTGANAPMTDPGTDTDPPSPAAPETAAADASSPADRDTGTVVAERATASPAGDDVAMPALPPVPAPPRRDERAFVAPGAGDPPAETDPAAAEAVIDAILDGGTPPAAGATVAGDELADETATDDAVTPHETDPTTLLAMIEAESGGATPRPFGDQEAPGRVVLVASEASWVQIRSADRAFVWTRTMEPGDAFFVPDREDLALWTGNAGGLRLILDGEPMDTLGDRGQVRRDIPLAAEALRAQYAGN